jgi:peroxiredoxin Q/BCP
MTIMIMDLGGQGPASGLKVGDPAPGIRVKTDEGRDFDLNERKGLWTVLYFYPKAGTPRCTKQACAFRDGISPIREMGAEVFGVSADRVEGIRKFKAKHNLTFTLLADPGLEVIRRYGTKIPLLKISKRRTFIVDPDLKIRAIDRNVDPVLDARHVAEVLKKLRTP